MPDLLVKILFGTISEATFWQSVSIIPPHYQRAGSTHKIRKMYMSVGVEEHVIGLDVPVDDTLAVDIPQGATQLGDPESDCLLSERLPRDVKP